MAYTNPSTFVAGTVGTAAFMNLNVRDNIRFLHGQPTARVRRAATQAFVTGAWDTVQFDTEDWDSDLIWSSTNNDQLFVRTPGKYLATASGGLAASTAGSLRSMAICKNSTANGSTVDSAEMRSPYDISNNSNGPLFSVSQMFSMTSTSYLTLQFFHDRGVDLASSTFRNTQPTLSILWVSS